MRLRFLKASAVMLSALLVGGCLSSLIPEPAPADIVYRLSSVGGSVPANEDAMIVRVDRPTVPTILGGKYIIVSPDGQRVATASQAVWSEPVPTLIQNSFFDALAARRKLVGVLPTSGARSTHRAHLTVRNFEARFDRGEDAAPLVIVHYTATVSNASSRNLIGTFDVEKTERAATRAVSSIVNAHHAANRAAMTDIADWMESLALKAGEETG